MNTVVYGEIIDGLIFVFRVNHAGWYYCEVLGTSVKSTICTSFETVLMSARSYTYLYEHRVRYET